MPVPNGSESWRTGRTLVKGDHVELLTAIPGHPELQPGKRGVVVLAADELEANGLCTVRIVGCPGRHVWQLPPRGLRWLGPRPNRQSAPEDA